MTAPEEQLDDSRIESLVASAADELRAARSGGEQVDIDELARKYPQIATTIYDLFPILLEFDDRVEKKIVSGSQPNNPDLDPEPQFQQLGDFKIHREIGRGGMGIVYEATQNSVDRRIALKVLPFANTLDELQLKRFKNEVRAAGSLSHSNIVPVFAMGQERGVHYYAMQIVDGISLAELIHDVRHNRKIEVSEPIHSTHADSENAINETHNIQQPLDAEISTRDTKISRQKTNSMSNREAMELKFHTQLITQAADAIAYAHSCGVIHRDIKPANLLVDHHRKLWITDFGLAHFENNQSVTTQGDLIGTVRYMSPEQAEADIQQVDHRTDIYSLGVTLYELLTSQSAIQGQTRSEILNNVKNSTPAPPRSINPAIPKTLEVIILKSIEKSKDDRYQRMKDFASDLHCFLEDKPILAKKSSLLDRARKWTKRHPSTVNNTAFGLAALALLLSVAIAFIMQERKKTHDALDSEMTHRERADENLRFACDIIQRAFTEEAARLKHVPGMTKRQKQFLQEVVEFYDKLPKHEVGDPEMLRETAAAHTRLGDAHLLLGDLKKSLARFHTAQTILQSLLKSQLDDRPQDNIHATSDRLQLARIQKAIGIVLAKQREFSQAVESLHSALQLVETVENQWQSRSSIDDHSHSQNGFIPNYEPLVLRSEIEIQLTEIYSATGKIEQAKSTISRTLKQFEKAIKDYSEITDVHVAYAVHRSRFATFHFKNGSSDDAERHLRSALERIQRIQIQHPDHSRLHSIAANLHNNLALICQSKGQRSDAKSHLEESISIWKELSVRFPNRPELHKHIANSLNNLAGLSYQSREYNQSILQYEESIQLIRAALKADPFSPQLIPILTGTLKNYSNVLKKVGRVFECQQIRIESINTWQALVERFPDRPDYKVEKAMAHYSLAEIVPKADGIAHVNKAIRVLEDFSNRHPENPTYLYRLTSCYNLLGGLHMQLGDRHASESAFLRAIEIAQQLTERWPRIPDHFGKLSRRHRHLGNLYFRESRYEDARECYLLSLAQESRLVSEFPEYKSPIYVVPIASIHCLIGTSIRKADSTAESAKQADEHFQYAAEEMKRLPNFLELRKELSTVLTREEIDEVIRTFDFERASDTSSPLESTQTNQQI